MKRDDVLSRLHVATPAPRDDKSRAPIIPDSVFEKKKHKVSDTDMGEPEELFNPAVELYNKDFWKQAEEDPDWDPQNFGPDWRHQYDLKDESWKFDSIPEIMDGINIADWIDPEIVTKVRELEKEEVLRLQRLEEIMANEEKFEISEEDRQAIAELREKRALTRIEHRLHKDKNKPTITRKDEIEREDIGTFEKHLVDLGIDPSNASRRIRERSLSRVGRKRERSLSVDHKDHNARSKTPHEEGFKDKKQKLAAEKLAKRAQKDRNKESKKGEGDRVILNAKPKHLYSGKRGIGKTERR